MCKDITRHSQNCGHAHIILQKCLKAYLFKKKPCRVPKRKFHTVIFDEICEPCTKFWQYHGVSEYEARKKYSQYRKKHRYQGPLGPVKHRSDAEPVLQRERFGAQDERIAEMLREADRDVQRASQISVTTNHTMWPTAVLPETDVTTVAPARLLSSVIMIGYVDQPREFNKSPSSSDSNVVLIKGARTIRPSPDLMDLSYKSDSQDANTTPAYDMDTLSAEHEINDAFTTVSIALSNLPQTPYPRNPLMHENIELLDSSETQEKVDLSTIANNGSVFMPTLLEPVQPLHIKKKITHEGSTNFRIRDDLAQGRIVRMPVSGPKNERRGREEETEHPRPPLSLPLRRMLDETQRRSLPLPPSPARLKGEHKGSPELDKPLPKLPHVPRQTETVTSQRKFMVPPPRLRDRLIL